MAGGVGDPNAGSGGRPNRPPLAFSTTGRAQTRPVPEPGSTMPGRPEIDEVAPPVLPDPIARPKMLTVCVIAWIASFVAGLAAIALSLLHGNKVRSQLVTKVQELRPSLSVDNRKHAADMLLSASAIAGVALVLLQLLFVHRLWARRRRTRIALAILGAVNIAILLLFEDALSGAVALRDSSERLDALGHAAMIVVAMVCMYWRSIGRWLRRKSAVYAEDDE